MTREEAIERLNVNIDRLQNAIKYAKYFDKEDARKDIEAFRIAVQTIEEQLEMYDKRL